MINYINIFICTIKKKICNLNAFVNNGGSILVNTEIFFSYSKFSFLWIKSKESNLGK